MIFGSFLLGVNEANAHLVGCEETHDALLVDIGERNAMIEDFLDEHALVLRQVFITHAHFDHTGGLRELAAHHHAEILAGADKVLGLRARRLAHGEEVRIGTIVGRAAQTEGHTADSISLILPGSPGMVFTGDALFAGSVGGTSSPEAAKREIDAIRNRILSLPDDYEIFPGHGPATTVSIEKYHNPFFA
ncbi:MAG TPA: MBL fold metallo-hydrolase [Candidatus Hydrogenedentes bacterium]|nr:MBL fold metallo-hydrolase [Candidatus Hydrogenedentota bacterium]HPG67137.1 MBL fold metallo-hydrolase [Candidatus Hydrogenedentota bacterium]